MSGMGAFWREPEARLPGIDGGHPSRRGTLEIALKGKWLVAAGALLGVAMAALYLTVTPPQYSAVAGVLIEGRSNPVSTGEAAGASAPLEISEIESQVELISSAKVVGSALDSLPPGIREDLDRQRPSVAGRIKSAISDEAYKLLGKAPKAAETGNADRERIDAVRDRLGVRRVGSSYVIEIAFTAFSPKAAAAVANAVASAYVQAQIQDKSDMWRRASVWMQQRLNDVGDQAAASARAAQEFKAANQIVDTGNRGLLNEQQLQEINTAMLDAKAKVVEARSKLDEARKILLAGDDGIVPDSLTDNVVSKLREQAAALRQQASQLEASFGPQHEAVLKTKADLRSVDVALMGELKRLVQSLQSNYDMAVARQSSLQASFTDLVSRSTITERAVVQAKELDRTAETYNTLYAGLLQRYTDAVNQQSFPIAAAQIISGAVLPQFPSAPRPSIAIVLGLFLGCGFGIVLVFARELADRSLSMTDQVESLGVHCFGLLPSLDREPTFNRRAAAITAAKALPPRIAADRLRAEFLLHDPGSLFAHSVQTMKTHIVLAGASQANKVIGITSPRSGDGKSTIAANLANLFSAHDKRTLLIDADLYDPTISRLLELSGRPGLAEILSGKATFEETLQVVPGRNLSVLSAGRADPDTVDGMFGSAQIRELLASAQQKFDRVIIDLPPVTEVVSTREVAPALDGIVVVATWGKTRAGTLDAALRMFRRDGTNVFGVVLNKASPRSLPNRSAYAAYGYRMRTRASA